jgi:Flp pilus assembly protein TadG
MRWPASPVPDGPGRPRPEAGSAVVEFVLVSGLVVALFLAVVQLGIALHVRNTLAAAAAEGARYAANADREPIDGVLRTEQIIRDSLSQRFANDVSLWRESIGPDAEVVVVEVRASLPIIGWLGPDRAMTVRGRALEEAAG